MTCAATKKRAKLMQHCKRNIHIYLVVKVGQLVGFTLFSSPPERLTLYVLNISTQHVVSHCVKYVRREVQKEAGRGKASSLSALNFPAGSQEIKKNAHYLTRSCKDGQNIKGTIKGEPKELLSLIGSIH